MAVDMRLVQKGKSEPRDGLTQQGETHVALGRQYADSLIESGWSTEDTSELEKNVALVKSMKPPQSEGREASEDASDPGSTAVNDAKVFLRRLRNALPRTLREAGETGITVNQFEAGEKLGRSAQGISTHLEKVRPSVTKLDDSLKKHFGGKKASEVLDNIKRALDAAPVTENAAREGSEPEEALAFYELKGRVLEGIEDLNRAGRIAFEGQGEVVGKFNKDILLRARRDRPVKQAGQSSAGS